MKKRSAHGGFIKIVSGHGNATPVQEIYKYPENHRCYGCPYTLNTTVPSCMFPERTGGGCFWYDIKETQQNKKTKGGVAHA